MRVYVDHCWDPVEYPRHWCVQFMYRGYEISISNGELVIFDKDQNALEDADGNVFTRRMSDAAPDGSVIDDAFFFIDCTIRDKHGKPQHKPEVEE